MDIICIKCKHVLNLDTEPDVGECPKCGGSTYQEGDIFDANLTHSQQNALDLMADIVDKRKNPNKVLN